MVSIPGRFQFPKRARRVAGKVWFPRKIQFPKHLELFCFFITLDMITQAALSWSEPVDLTKQSAL